MSDQEVIARGDRIRTFVGTEGHEEYQRILMDRLMATFQVFLGAKDRDECWEASIRGSEVWQQMRLAHEADLLGRQARQRLEEAYAEAARQERTAAERTSAGRRLARLRPAASPLGGGI